MSRRLAFAAFVLVLAGTLVQAQAEQFTIEAARWGTSAAPREATGGDRGVPVTVLVHNVGTSDYNSATARLLDTDGLVVTVPGGDVAALSSTFAAGALWEATFRVDVASEVTAGDVLRPRIELEVWRSGSSDETTFTTQLRVPGRTEVGIAPVDPLVPGSAAVTAAVRVVNDGDGATGPVSVVVRPAAGSGLLLAGDDAWTTGALGPGAAETLSIPLRTPSTRGVHALEATLSYLDAAGAAVVDERTLAFQVSSAARGPLRVEVGSTAVAAGRNGTIEFALHNAGDAPIAGLRLSATTDGVAMSTTGGGTLDAPTDLAAGARATARLPVLVALTAEDLAKVTVEASYVVGDAEHDETFELAVPVEGRVDLRILALEVVGGDVSGIVVNTGTGTAYNARATVGSATAVLSEDLAPNEPVSFRVPGAGASAGDLSVAFDWNDDRGQVRSATVEGRAREIGGSSERTLPAAGWVAAAFAAFAAAALTRRG